MNKHVATNKKINMKNIKQSCMIQRWDDDEQTRQYYSNWFITHPWKQSREQALVDLNQWMQHEIYRCGCEYKYSII